MTCTMSSGIICIRPLDVPNLYSEKGLKEFVRAFDQFRNNAEMLNISFDDRMIYKHIYSKFEKRDILRFQSECTRDGLEIYRLKPERLG